MERDTIPRGGEASGRRRHRRTPKGMAASEQAPGDQREDEKRLDDGPENSERPSYLRHEVRGLFEEPLKPHPFGHCEKLAPIGGHSGEAVGQPAGQVVPTSPAQVALGFLVDFVEKRAVQILPLRPDPVNEKENEPWWQAGHIQLT